MWRTAPTEQPARAARAVTLVATVVFTLIVCRMQPWDLFTDAGFSNDFYDEQARSFLRLRLAVRPDVPGPEGFLIDGRTYLYYGPFLALARLPFAMLGALFGDNVFAGRLTRISMIVGFVVLCTGSYHLLEAARRWVAGKWPQPDPETGASATAAPRAGSAWRAGGFVAAVACSPALFLTGWVSVYHETELWAAAFAVWAMVGVLRCATVPTLRAAVLTGAAIAAAILTRAPVGIGMAVGAGLVALSMFRRERHNSMIVLGACVAGFATHVAVNVAKFGSLLDLPAERQVLSINDASRAAWFAGNNGSFFSPRFLSTTIVHYLRPDTVRFERLTPFIRFGPLATDRSSYPLETITPAASLSATATVLLAAGAIGAVVLLTRRAWVPLALMIGGAIAALPTFTIGFIGNRYLVDMLPLLILPAAFAFAALAPQSDRVRRAGRFALAVLVVWGTWTNTALAVWTQNLKEPGFTEARYRIDGAIFSDPAPALVVYDPSAPVPRDGIVAIVADAANCDAVYIAEQGVWVSLERANNGIRRIHATLRVDPGQPCLDAGGTGETRLVEGPAGADGTPIWTLGLTDAAPRSLVARGVGDGVGDGDIVAELPGHIAERLGAAAGGVGIDIVADEIVGQFSVTMAREMVMFSFSAPPGPLLRTDALAEHHDRDDSLCRRLQARR